jgi:hypothetical protein
LRVREEVALPEHPVVGRDVGAPGVEVRGDGYTEANRVGEVLGHSARLRRAGWDAVAENDPRQVITVDEAGLREGMSGSPVIDLVSGTVVGIVKRTSGGTGGWLTPLAMVAPELCDLFAANAARKPDPEAVAMDLWGELVDVAAAPLATNMVALRWLARELGVEQQLSGEQYRQARLVARALFLADLEAITDRAPSIAARLDASAALHILEAVAVCATYRGDPWIPRAAVLELVAEIDLVAAGEPARGRVLDLPSDEVDFREPFVRRGDSRRKWLARVDLTSLASAELDDRSGLPADVERELRLAIVERSHSGRSTRRLSAPDLSEQDRELWEQRRGELTAQLAEGRMVVFLPEDLVLDDALIAALADRYPFVFLAWSEDGVQSGTAAYRVLDAGVQTTLATEAFQVYDVARKNLKKLAAEGAR